MIHAEKSTFEEKLTRAPKSWGYFCVGKAFNMLPSCEQNTVIG